MQSIRGPEVWTWTDRNAWASNLLRAIGKQFDQNMREGNASPG
ncbi:MAG: hypothetical protein R2748_12805 [Bryobacterales bacterium]